jgi:hypothetical protein
MREIEFRGDQGRSQMEFGNEGLERGLAIAGGEG